VSRLTAHAHQAHGPYDVISSLSRCESTPTHTSLPFLRILYAHYYEQHTTYHASITNIFTRHPSNCVNTITLQVDNFIIFTSTLLYLLLHTSTCYCVVYTCRVALPRIHGICRVVSRALLVLTFNISKFVLLNGTMFATIPLFAPPPFRDVKTGYEPNRRGVHTYRSVMVDFSPARFLETHF
jgi:hypothetical protein